MPKFKSALPCPTVDLPSGERVQFTDHHADVSAEVAKELRSVDGLGFLGLEEVKGRPAKGDPGPDQ